MNSEPLHEPYIVLKTAPQPVFGMRRCFYAGKDNKEAKIHCEKINCKTIFAICK